MRNLCKVLTFAKGKLQSLDLLKLCVCLIALESANALLRPKFVFRNNPALHLWKSCYPQAAREESQVLVVKVEVRILFSVAEGN